MEVAGASVCWIFGQWNGQGGRAGYGHVEGELADALDREAPIDDLADGDGPERQLLAAVLGRDSVSCAEP